MQSWHVVGAAQDTLLAACTSPLRNLGQGLLIFSFCRFVFLYSNHIGSLHVGKSTGWGVMKGTGTQNSPEYPPTAPKLFKQLFVFAPVVDHNQEQIKLTKKRPDSEIGYKSGTGHVYCPHCAGRVTQVSYVIGKSFPPR